MQPYLISAAAGILVGLIYGLLSVRSPAPPVIALVGLLGMLLGEQIVPLVRLLAAGHPVATIWSRADCASHVFGDLPRGRQEAAPVPPTDPA